MREVLSQIVGSLVGQIFEAADGDEAVAICAEERPDWVLLDLRMRRMDGLHACAEIKTRFPDTRIAIVTQYDDVELQAEAIQAGACAYVLKENLLVLPGILLGQLAPFPLPESFPNQRQDPPGPTSSNSSSPA
jgi:CheY-like chemotaxis protein